MALQLTGAIEIERDPEYECAQCGWEVDEFTACVKCGKALDIDQEFYCRDGKEHLCYECGAKEEGIWVYTDEELANMEEAVTIIPGQLSLFPDIVPNVPKENVDV